MSQFASAAIVVHGPPAADCSITIAGMTTMAVVTIDHSKRRSAWAPDDSKRGPPVRPVLSSLR